MKTTYQMDCWSGEFGASYTERNATTVAGVDQEYRDKFNLPRTEMNDRFLGSLDKEIKILEVGCNIGLQLEILGNMGFHNLHGIDLQERAIAQIYARDLGIKAMPGTAFDIPFRDDYFDLVFTSGVLIHINPDDLQAAMGEMYRCTKKYIWGFEYYAPTTEERPYRDHQNLLWRADYAGLWQQYYPRLHLVKSEYFHYTDSPNTDCMYLLEKR